MMGLIGLMIVRVLMGRVQRVKWRGSVAILLVQVGINEILLIVRACRGSIFVCRVLLVGMDMFLMRGLVFVSLWLWKRFMGVMISMFIRRMRVLYDVGLISGLIESFVGVRNDLVVLSNHVQKATK